MERGCLTTGNTLTRVGPRALCAGVTIHHRARAKRVRRAQPVRGVRGLPVSCKGRAPSRGPLPCRRVREDKTLRGCAGTVLDSGPCGDGGDGGEVRERGVERERGAGARGGWSRTSCCRRLPLQRGGGVVSGRHCVCVCVCVRARGPMASGMRWQFRSSRRDCGFQQYTLPRARHRLG